MRQARIAGVSRHRGFVVTPRRDEGQRPAPDLVQREFTTDGPNVADWCIGETQDADPVQAALSMVLEQRKVTGSSTSATKAASRPSRRLLSRRQSSQLRIQVDVNFRKQL